MSEQGARQVVSGGTAAQVASGRQASRPGGDLAQLPYLRPVAQRVRLSLRGELSALADALTSAGVPISQSVCRAVEGVGCVALWLGPDEQLLLVEEKHGPRLAQILSERLGAVPHSLVDISQRQVAFEVAGPTARTLLASGCPLDLRDDAFSVGMCTRTLFDKSEIVLWRSGPDVFQIEVGRSFAAYVTGLLAQTALELGS
jgi:sarcosine oxidase subunit gamma